MPNASTGCTTKRTSRCAASSARKSRAGSACRKGSSKAGRLLVGGFRQRQAGRRAADSCAHGRRSVHAGMHLAGSGSRHEPAQSGGGTHPGYRRARARPRSLTLDNGSEFAGRAMEALGHQLRRATMLIRPGRPVENGYIESFNGRSATSVSTWSRSFLDRRTPKAGALAPSLQPATPAQCA